jgi:hypothetical protein
VTELLVANGANVHATRSERTCRCRRTRRFGVMCAEQGACVRRRSWPGYTIDMFEFEFPTGTPVISSSHLGHSQKSHGCFIPLRGLRHRPGLGPCRRVLLCHRGVWEFAIESAMAMGSTTAHRIEPAHDAQAPASFPRSWLPSDPWRPLVAPVEPVTPPLPTAPKGA